jgi:hypothetical protein
VLAAVAPAAPAVGAAFALGGLATGQARKTRARCRPPPKNGWAWVGHARKKFMLNCHYSPSNA